MPVGRGKLTDQEIAVLRRWVEQDAAWPEEGVAKKPRGWDHWAFQTPKRPPVPTVGNAAWVRDPIDNFILAKLEREQVQPSPEADRERCYGG